MTTNTLTQLVGTGPMQRSLIDFEIACGVYIDNEQRQPLPDNALIALLCDAVRLARAHADALAPSVIGKTTRGLPNIG